MIIIALKLKAKSMFCTVDAMNILKLEVFTVLLMKAKFFWDVMPCQLVSSY